ncbi:Malonate transporter MadL protein [Salinisphaera shabanensis E1L3A]|uniref:Malonate transporter MadL protein n=1 Tax=Salinisphaera shabanensis E1L3A TaxID=1033802 RepID=U2FZG5_9GAMM|nr:malonate transporter subunit MadL [Salinisphaera shabanensis]ERJ19493.1 Malonate transporter MadL protein [Salinisphaera shabanensis E1L3A]
MIIYGVALLAACMLAGNIIGELIGMAIGVSSNVGGVGLAMLLLVFVVYRLQKAGCLDTSSRRGVEFWSSLYIPIVVAMAASQNVVGAVTGGPVALVGGLIVVAASFALVPVIARLGKGKYAVPLDDVEAERGDRNA